MLYARDAGMVSEMVDQHVRYPDLSARPHSCVVERVIRASASLLYLAWTKGIDIWFAAPDSVRMRPLVGEPFYFEVEREQQRYPHYGRFLRLEPDHAVELTWVSGPHGTQGAETVVRVELIHQPRGVRVRLRHSGFPDQEMCDRHQESWTRVLKQLEQRITVEP